MVGFPQNWWVGKRAVVKIISKRTFIVPVQILDKVKTRALVSYVEWNTKTSQSIWENSLQVLCQFLLKTNVRRQKVSPLMQENVQTEQILS